MSQMKRMLATVVAAALAKCASKSEFGQIHHGQTMAKVHGILDQQKIIFGYATPGGDPAALEQYATCG
jgi:hypothetical protein